MKSSGLLLAILLVFIIIPASAIAAGNITYDLGDRDLGDFIGQDNAQAMAFDPSNNITYFGGTSGLFGYYNYTEDRMYNLSGTDFNNWISTKQITSLAFDTIHNLIYIGALSGTYGFYNISNNASYDLSARDIGDFIGSNNINALAYDDNNGMLYIGPENCRFGMYNFTANTTYDLNGTDPDDWCNDQVSINDLAFDRNNNLIYIAGSFQNRSGVYDVAANITYNLNGTRVGFSSASSFTDVAFDHVSNLTYFSSSSALAIYNRTANITYNISATGTGPSNWIASSSITDIQFDSNSNVLYLVGQITSGGYPNFGMYNRSTNLTYNLTGTFTGNLTRSIADARQLYAMSIDSNRNDVYFSEQFGRIGVYSIDDFYRLQLNYCGRGDRTSDARAYVLTTRNESDTLSINGVSVEAAMSGNYSLVSGIVSQSFNFSSPSNSTYEICFNPSWRTATIDATMKYYSDSYSTRTYYLSNAEMTNSTQTINLYLLKKSLSYLGCTLAPCSTVFTIKNNAGETQEGVHVKVQRYYIPSNTYATVTILKTDINGNAITFLEPETVLYGYILEKDNAILDTIDAFQLNDNEITFIIQPSSLVEYFKYNNQIAVLCTYVNSTGEISCAFSDTSGLANENCLDIKQVGRITTVPYFKSCSSSSGATIGTTLTDVGNKSYLYEAYVVRNGVDIILSQGLIEGIPHSSYAISGLFLTFIIVTTSAFIGVYDPKVSVVLALASLGLMQFLGLIGITFEQYSMILFAGIMLLFVMIRRSS